MKFFEGLIFFLHRTDGFFQLAHWQIGVVPIVIAVGDVPFTAYQVENDTQRRLRLIISGLELFMGRSILRKAGYVSSSLLLRNTSFPQRLTIQQRPFIAGKRERLLRLSVIFSKIMGDFKGNLMREY